MEDTYVYISVKLYLKEGQTEDSIQEIVSEMDYSFSHDDVVEHEIVDIIDTQIPNKYHDDEYSNIDVFDSSGFDIEA